MLRPVRSTFKRKPRKKIVSRSFRVPPDVDRALEAEARRKRWSKSFLIRDILVSWLTYQKAEGKVK
jgi:predicted transcriptional regulator